MYNDVFLLRQYYLNKIITALGNENGQFVTQKKQTKSMFFV